MTLRVGTRGSQLALWQARFVAAAIARAGGPACELVVIKTSGDRFADAPLARIGGKRLFVKEIEDALLTGNVDLAVHSAKDVPAELPPGIALAAAPAREDPRDVVVLPRNARTEAVLPPELDEAACRTLASSLGSMPRIGTSSVRRVAQLARLIAGARFEAIRGNLDTRLSKLDEGSYEALVLAAAGLRRLGFADRISAPLSIEACVPAPGQGAIAVETRVDDPRARAAVQPISHATTMAAVVAERTLVAALGGGCQAPIGAIAFADPRGAARGGENHLRLEAIATSLDGRRFVRRAGSGRLDDPAALGRDVATALLEAGAGEILEEVRRSQAPVEGSP